MPPLMVASVLTAVAAAAWGCGAQEGMKTALAAARVEVEALRAKGRCFDRDLANLESKVK